MFAILDDLHDKWTAARITAGVYHDLPCRHEMYSWAQLG